VELVEHASINPAFQPPPAGRTGAAAEFLRDFKHGEVVNLTALEWCRLGDSPGHQQAEALLRAVTAT
jgi:hypothetical protein